MTIKTKIIMDENSFSAQIKKTYADLNSYKLFLANLSTTQKEQQAPFIELRKKEIALLAKNYNAIKEQISDDTVHETMSAIMLLEWGTCRSPIPP